MDNTKQILIVGAGSIGQRHLRNLKTLGWENITVLRRKPDPEFEEAHSVRVITDYREMEVAPYAVVACNPTSLHLDPLRYAALSGTHLFMEKPLIHTESGLKEAEKLLSGFSGLFFIGYMLRFHPAIEVIDRIVKSSLAGEAVIPKQLMTELKEQGDERDPKRTLLSHSQHPDSDMGLKAEHSLSEIPLNLGAPFSARLEFGSYLPGWPYKEYKQSYAAKRDLGGGVINTISHELDLICHLFGTPGKLSATAFNIGRLGIEAEEMCEALFVYRDMAVTLHLDYLQKTYDRRIRILFSEGTLEWDWSSETIQIFPAAGDKVSLYVPMGDLNSLYLDEMKAFLNLAAANQKNHPLDSDYSLLNTRLLLLMHHSSRNGITVDV
ncbi:MAG: gfo/Idh/MocA family oxidoreductase [Balneolaceae bacterium]|nr:MAG: gfo/Idh/MocA family oxidoreductase [Balneolaceae bacterium]